MIAQKLPSAKRYRRTPIRLHAVHKAIRDGKNLKGKKKKQLNGGIILKFEVSNAESRLARIFKVRIRW